MSVPPRKTYSKPYKKYPTKGRTYNSKLKTEVRREVIKELRAKADLKYADRTAANANMTSAGTIIDILGNLVRGDNGLDNFQGNSIKPKGVTLSYGVHTDQTYNMCRVMLFQWRDSGTPAVTGILSSTATGIAPFSNIYVTNRKNIKVLYDRAFPVAPTAGGDTTVLGQGTYCDKVYIDGSRIGKVTYQSTSNTIQDGGIYLMIISDDSLITYPQFTYFVRTSFWDD